LVQVGRELWRVMRDDGVWFLNLGDSYAAQGGDHALSKFTEKLLPETMASSP
jgi:hypothetical protein